MAVALSPPAEAAPLTRAERKLVRTLRLLALLFAIAAIGFVLRPDETVGALDRIGAVVGLPTLSRSAVPVASDFWLPLAIGNVVAMAAGAWYAAGDVRRRRAVAYPLVASTLGAAATCVLLFVRWAAAFSFLAAALLNLAIAFTLITALRATPAERRPA
jgi:hypothetical protein